MQCAEGLSEVGICDDGAEDWLFERDERDVVVPDQDVSRDVAESGIEIAYGIQLTKELLRVFAGLF